MYSKCALYFLSLLQQMYQLFEDKNKAPYCNLLLFKSLMIMVVPGQNGLILHGVRYVLHSVAKVIKKSI